MRHYAFDCNRQNVFSALKILLLSECTGERIFTIMELSIFQNCDLVFHFRVPAFSSPEIWSVIFQVLHFPALRFCPSFSRSCIFQSDLFWSVIFRSCKFSARKFITIIRVAQTRFQLYEYHHRRHHHSYQKQFVVRGYR